MILLFTITDQVGDFMQLEIFWQQLEFFVDYD